MIREAVALLACTGGRGKKEGGNTICPREKEKLMVGVGRPGKKVDKFTAVITENREKSLQSLKRRRWGREKS